MFNNSNGYVFLFFLVIVCSNPYMHARIYNHNDMGLSLFSSSVLSTFFLFIVNIEIHISL